VEDKKYLGNNVYTVEKVIFITLLKKNNLTFFLLVYFIFIVHIDLRKLRCGGGGLCCKATYSQVTAKALLAQPDMFRTPILTQKSSSIVGLLRHAGREKKGYKIGREREG